MHSSIRLTARDEVQVALVEDPAAIVHLPLLVMVVHHSNIAKNCQRKYEDRGHRTDNSGLMGCMDGGVYICVWVKVQIYNCYLTDSSEYKKIFLADFCHVHKAPNISYCVTGIIGWSYREIPQYSGLYTYPQASGHYTHDLTRQKASHLFWMAYMAFPKGQWLSLRGIQRSSDPDQVRSHSHRRTQIQTPTYQLADSLCMPELVPPTVQNFVKSWLRNCCSQSGQSFEHW